MLLAVFPPLRRVVSEAASRAIFWVATPLTPLVADFDELPEPTRFLAADGSELASLSATGGRREPLALDAIPEHVQRAVLAAEDARFYRHRGVDPQALGRAALNTVRGRTQGGSTITQQLAKINYTAGERTLLRKVKEVLYASALERRYSKDKLLERYLNQVYFGEGAYGIEAAARSFFGVEPAALTPAQAALLAGKIKAPNTLDPRRDLKAVLARRDQVLRAMVEHGWLSDDELEMALGEAVVLWPPQRPGVVRAPHFVEHVKREASQLEELGEDPDSRLTHLLTGGYTVETTLEPKLFDATQASVLARLGAPEDPITAVASVEPGDGAIRNLFGGLDFVATQFGYADRAARQPGSSFKPFVYLAAIHEGIDPRSAFDGTSGRRIPCYGKKPVRNYAGEDFGGRIDVDSAMVRSVNVVFVDLGCQVGVEKVLDTAQAAGIPEDATEVQGAVFLGGLDRGVNPLLMASAYATFASGGSYAEPYSITTIRDRKGKVVYEHDSEPRHVFDPAEVGVLNNVLRRVVAEGTGRAARIGRPVAGKTGTSQENLDAWFVGYVPQLSTAVWTGYEPKRPMVDVHDRTVTGGSFPAVIFSDLMRAGLEGVPVKALPITTPGELALARLGPPPPPPPPPLPPPPADLVPPPAAVPPVAPPAEPAVPEATTTTTQSPPSPPPSTTTTTPPPPTTTTSGGP